jgi:hypothetical protein
MPEMKRSLRDESPEEIMGRLRPLVKDPRLSAREPSLGGSGSLETLMGAFAAGERELEALTPQERAKMGGFPTLVF